MVAINAKHPERLKLLAMLKRQSVMLSVETAETRITSAALRPTVYQPTRRGEMTNQDVAVHKV